MFPVPRPPAKPMVSPTRLCWRLTIPLLLMLRMRSSRCLEWSLPTAVGHGSSSLVVNLVYLRLSKPLP